MHRLLKYSIFLVIAALMFGAAVFYLNKQTLTTVSYERVDILIKNANVVTMDEQGHIYNPGWIAIKGDKILAVGPGLPESKYLPNKTLDAAGEIVMPGLVNTHSHAAMTLLTGLGQGLPLSQWLQTMNGYEAKLTADDVYWGSLLAEDRMLKSGTTVFNDMYLDEPSTAKAVADAKIRAVLRVPLINTNGQISLDESFIAASQNNPLISLSLAPNPLLDYTPDQLQQISKIGLARNFIIHIHFEENREARVDTLYKYNITPLDLITNAGFLKNKIVLAHAVDLNSDEMPLLSGLGNVGVSFNPMSESNLVTPLTPVVDLQKNNVIVGLGTDGEPSSNLDMFAQMKFAAQNTALKPQEIVQMATINGAKVLGLEKQVGSLEAGKQADIIFVQPSVVQSDIYATLVYNTLGEDVTHVFIAGVPIVEDKKVLTLNEDEIVTQSQQISNRIKGAQ